MTVIQEPVYSQAVGTPIHKKLSGRELFKQIGEPTKIVAPMVDQSELAWRILSRRYGATLCYTPMMHARLFATDPKYRSDMWCDMDGDAKVDRPLVVQFCANDADYLLQAAQFVEDHCDAVDLNLGCPQGIARKGNYGAFLMDDWERIHNLISTLHVNLKVPVTAKIRIFPNDKEKTLRYAKMILSAGAQFLTVHGRTREMKGQKTGIADWDIIRYLRDNLPPDLVFFANGNILYPEDIDRCMKHTTADGVMSAEGNLYNPGVFATEESDDKERQFPRLDKILREYFDIIKSTQPQSKASQIAMKSHFFKLLRPILGIETELRNKIGKTSVRASMETWEAIVCEAEQIIGKIYEQNKDKDIIVNGPTEWWGGHYKEVPYWRCQPYFRKVDGQSVKDKISQSGDDDKGGKEESKEEMSKEEVMVDAKRRQEQQDADEQTTKKIKSA